MLLVIIVDCGVVVMVGRSRRLGMRPEGGSEKETATLKENGWDYMIV